MSFPAPGGPAPAPRGGRGGVGGAARGCGGGGLIVSGVAGRLELFTVGTTGYTGLTLSGGSVSLVGVDAFSLDVANAFVRYNAVSPAGTKLDWTTLSDTSTRLAGVEQTPALAGASDVGVSVAP